MTNPIPEGFTTITPSLVVRGAAKAIELYKKAFGAEELSRSEFPGTGQIMHAVLKIGNAMLLIADEMPGMCKASANASFYLYMPDADAAFARAVKAGLTEKWPLTDQFWGERSGVVSDEFGVMWNIATHKRDVSPAEIEKGAKEMAAKMKGGKAA